MNMDQFKHMHDWRKQWDGFFGDSFWKGFEPMMNNVTSQVNLYKSENELLVVMSIPGLENVDNLDLFVQYQTLEVRGKVNLRFKGFELVEEGIFQGEFERVVQLPFPVREDRIDASYHNGLLIIHLHKRIPDDNRKKIAIKKIDE
ncbi:Hsp20/alpha crystallin family protein [Bacillus sp. PS06]|uniref:Hsp20/alpha crystallin family protein n=1 Tax=Bacillus sp. PS06 TaxID=2764176 RepID=UPI00177AE146|nr:Hsp20/alpha crystallin family protein [Bacillus sp. PS06]MBD8069664.1 Hsp20/alpha crystallin family protein [Bacillus sp. PS06]